MNERIGGDRSSLFSTTIVCGKNQLASRNYRGQGGPMPNIRTTSHVYRSTRPWRRTRNATRLPPRSYRQFRHHSGQGAQRGDGTPAKITPTHYFATLMTALMRNPSDRQDCMFIKAVAPACIASRAAVKVRGHHGRFFQRIERRGTGRRQHHEPFGTALDRVHRHGAGRTAMRADILGPAKDPAKLQCHSEPDRGRKTQDS